MSSHRTVRLFLSSTFRDFGEERDLLVRQVFPALRARLKDRFVELVDVDLRWGITVEQAERGEVLPICLAEIDRARPYFIGMLGERYGWIPPPEGFAPDLIERQPWLKKHQGGKSVTELEILHGVLNKRRMKGRAFFYFRAPGYAKAKGGEYVPASPEDRDRQSDLKRRIQSSGYPVTAYRHPQALAKRIERDLWKLLDAEFPASSVPDAFEREAMRHEAYATPRRRLYLGGERYQAQLTTALDSGEQRIVIEGASGSGKSALMANFFEGYRKRHTKHSIHEHYLGASADAGDPHALVRRLCEFIKRKTQSSEEIESEPQKLMDSLPLWLATASGWARQRKTRFVFVLDALNSLTDQQDLRWWPAFLPQGVHFVVSCLTGDTLQVLHTRTTDKPWKRLLIRPLSAAGRRELLVTFLARYNKTLPKALLSRALAHPLADNPMFIRTLAEELRLFGIHEELQRKLDHYLSSQTMDDLFERMLERVEGDCGASAVRDAMVAIRSGRAGLSEAELLGVTGLIPATWAPIRHALDEALLESGGRIIFAHDYLRIAVDDRYLPTPELKAQAHRDVARWFRARPANARRAEEEPWQWAAARDWRALKGCLTDSKMFLALESLGGSRVMQGYWRKLLERDGIQMAQVLPRAWRRWRLPKAEVSSGRLTMHVAELLNFCSHYAEALKVARHGVAMLVASVGDDHESTLRARNTLSSVYTASSRYRDAMAENEKVLAACTPALRRRGVRGAIHADALNFAAGNAYYLGDYVGSLPQFEAVLAFRRRTLGPAHPKTIQAINNVANVHLESGRYDQALALHSENLLAARRTLGDEHPTLGLYLSNHAHAVEKSGDLQSAVRGYEAAIEVYQRTLGHVCADLVLPLGNLGLLRHQMGDMEASRRLQQRCLSVVRAVLGNHHRETVRSLVNLAVVTEEVAERRPLLEEAYAVGREVLGDHVMTAAALGQLGWVSSEEGDLDNAEKMLLESHAMFVRLLPPRHYMIIDALFSLAQFRYYQRDDDDAALEGLDQCLRMQIGLTGAPIAKLPEICLVASWIYQGREAWDDARRVLGLSLAQLDKVHGSGSRHHPPHLAELAEVEMLAGDFVNAEGLFEQAIAIAESVEGYEIPSLCQMLYKYGGMREQQGEVAAALSLYERCLVHAQRRHGTDGIGLANILVIVAAVREQAGDLAGAIDARERVEKMIDSLAEIDEDRAEQRQVNKDGLIRLYAQMGRTSRG